MKRLMNRRALLTTATAATVLAAGLARAQATFPGQQPIRIVVPSTPGGATDILGRIVGQKLSEAWNTPVIVDNKPGAGGAIGANFVAKAAPDGHTILLTVPLLIQQRTLMNLPYDPIKDFAPVLMVMKSFSIFAVMPSTPATNLKEFVAMVKASPGKFSYGSYGIGSLAHINGALLNMQAGLDMTHVPYQGAAPMLQALLGGQVTSAFIDTATAGANLKSVHPLAVTGPERSRVLPDVPTFKELGYKDLEFNGWYGLFLPSATPAAIVSRYADEVNRILRLPDVIERIESFGLMVGGGTSETFAQTVRAEDQMYARIIKEANIKINQ
jgi:tripartite-type tricarboxylate transporter receptor subunit TctC